MAGLLPLALPRPVPASPKWPGTLLQSRQRSNRISGTAVRGRRGRACASSGGRRGYCRKWADTILLSAMIPTHPQPVSGPPAHFPGFLQALPLRAPRTSRSSFRWSLKFLAGIPSHTHLLRAWSRCLRGHPMQDRESLLSSSSRKRRAGPLERVWNATRGRDVERLCEDQADPHKKPGHAP